jgi:lysozyme
MTASTCATSFGGRFLHHPEIGNYHLWIAEYGVSSPKVPYLWEKRGWLIWQHSSAGKIGGDLLLMDLDLLRGDPDEL